MSSTVHDIIVVLAFIAGVSLGTYVLTHMKMVIEKLKSNHGRSLFALGIIGFIFYAFAHPKVSEIIVEGFGMKAKVAQLDKEIGEKQAVIAQLTGKIESQREQVVSLQSDFQSYADKLTTPLNKSLAELQKVREPVAAFPGGIIAVNPKLLPADHQPETIKALKESEWVVTTAKPAAKAIASTEKPGSVSATWPIFLMQTQSLESEPNVDRALIFDTATKQYRTKKLNPDEIQFLYKAMEKP